MSGPHPGRARRVIGTLGAIARVGVMAGGMLAIGWALLGDRGLTTRQYVTFGLATTCLAWACDATIRVALAGPEHAEEEAG